MLSAGECPRALQPLLPGCPLSWSLAAGQGTCSLPFLVSSSGLTACWLSAPVSLHTAPSLPPCTHRNPAPQCSPPPSLGLASAGVAHVLCVSALQPTPGSEKGSVLILPLRFKKYFILTQAPWERSILKLLVKH